MVKTLLSCPRLQDTIYCCQPVTASKRLTLTLTETPRRPGPDAWTRAGAECRSPQEQTVRPGARRRHSGTKGVCISIDAAKREDVKIKVY